MQRRTPKFIDGEECWLCPTCGMWKSRGDYYARARHWNGIGTQCRKCHSVGNIRTRDKDRHRNTRRDSMAARRSAEPEKYRERDRISASKRLWTLAREARYQLNLAVLRGDVLRPNKCVRCSMSRKLHAHHADYARPLSVEWLCTRCHGIEHRIEFRKVEQAKCATGRS